MQSNNSIAIVIDQKDGQNVVSARELYIGLGLSLSQWKRWRNKNIVNSEDFTEFEDYEGFDIMSNGNKVQDFIITLDMAKELTMLSRTAKGKEIRKYFIAKEKEAQVLKLQLAEQNTKQIQKLTEGLKALQIQTSYRENYTTIKGFINIHKIKVNYKAYSSLGRSASKQCREKGLEIGKANDVQHGEVNTYPKEVLAIVFKSYLG